MKTAIRTLLLALAATGPVAQAAGPLYLDDSSPPRPLVWDTSKGSIPVWTDGGGVTRLAALEAGLGSRVPVFIKVVVRVKVHTETRAFAGRA